MKKLLLFLVLISPTLNAQNNKIKLSFEFFESQSNKKINLDSIQKIYKWFFNDDLITTNGIIELKSNYPQFDTLILVNKVKNDTTTIYSILKANENFKVSCDIRIDYVSLIGNNSSKYPSNINQVDFYDYFKKIEYGTVQFSGKNIPKNTTIIGTYGYNIGISKGVKIENTQTNFKLQPFSAGMNPGTSKEIIIGEYKETNNKVSDSLYSKNETVYFLLNSNKTLKENKPVLIKEKKHKFYIRLFDNENAIIEYDYKNNKYKVSQK